MRLSKAPCTPTEPLSLENVKLKNRIRELEERLTSLPLLPQQPLSELPSVNLASRPESQLASSSNPPEEPEVSYASSPIEEDLPTSSAARTTPAASIKAATSAFMEESLQWEVPPHM